MKISLFLAVTLIIAGLSLADITENYGWEGTDTILGNYGDIDAEIATDPVHGGSQSLHLTDQAASGTPQAFIAWVTGLENGDEVTASFWRYDTTPGASPSCRIWGHWNDDPGDINGYDGSAGGNSEYGPGTGWDETSHTWTVADGHTGLVIESRTYSSPGDEVWIDDMTVTAPDGTTIILPGDLALSASTWADIKASF